MNGLLTVELLALLTLVLILPLANASTLSGYVNNTLGAPVPDARIDLNDGAYYTFSDDLGQYSISVPEGMYSVIVRAGLYNTHALSQYIGSSNTTLNMTLSNLEGSSVMDIPGVSVFEGILMLIIAFQLKNFNRKKAGK